MHTNLLIPTSWTLFEWLRSWLFTGFPWLTAGYAATGWPLQGYAPLAGVFGVSFVTLSLSGLVWSIVRGNHTRVFLAAVLALVIAGEAQPSTAGHPRGALLRAYDKATGKDAGAVLMPAQQTGSPMTYMLNGKQYIVIAIGGGNYPGELVAFRLPG